MDFAFIMGYEPAVVPTLFKFKLHVQKLNMPTISQKSSLYVEELRTLHTLLSQVSFDPWCKVSQ
jgi:hypothetical protein